MFELANGVGGGLSGRADAAAFNCWPSNGLHRLAFEIKQSRGDFMRELERPAKRQWVEANFHQTWFVVPYRLVKPEEVPESWGLLMVTKEGTALRKAKQAMHRDPAPMPEGLALSAIRALGDQLGAERNRRYKIDGEAITVDQLQQMVSRMLDAQHEALVAQTVRVEEERRLLAAERSLFAEPLRVLASAVLGDRFSVGSRLGKTKDVPELTVDDVRAWIGKADLIRDGLNVHVLRRARESLEEVLKSIGG